MRLLSLEGIQASTPREAVKEAFRVGWIDDEEEWLVMIADRNATSHVDNEAQARQIYKRIRKHAPRLRKAYRFLQRKLL